MLNPRKTQTVNLAIKIRRQRAKSIIDKRMKGKRRSPKDKTNWLSLLENPQKNQKLSISGLINMPKDLQMRLKLLQPKNKL